MRYFAYAYNGRGNGYLGLEQYKKAISDYNEAIRLKPDYAYAYGNRALAYDKLGKSSKAVQDRKKMKELTDKR